jgi:hypothetical protein
MLRILTNLHSKINGQNLYDLMREYNTVVAIGQNRAADVAVEHSRRCGKLKLLDLVVRCTTCGEVTDVGSDTRMNATWQARSHPISPLDVATWQSRSHPISPLDGGHVAISEPLDLAVGWKPRGNLGATRSRRWMGATWQSRSPWISSLDVSTWQAESHQISSLDELHVAISEPPNFLHVAISEPLDLYVRWMPRGIIKALGCTPRVGSALDRIVVAAKWRV